MPMIYRLEEGKPLDSPTGSAKYGDYFSYTEYGLMYGEKTYDNDCDEVIRFSQKPAGDASRGQVDLGEEVISLC